MKPKMIAIDIDGTLFDSQGRISDRTLDAIRDCIQNDIQVVLATGRDYDALPHDRIDGIGIQYVVATNGSGIYELGTRKCIYEEVMGKIDVSEILGYIQGRNLFPYLFIDGKGYAQKSQVEIFERVAWPDHLKNETRERMYLVDDLLDLVRNSNVQKGAILFPKEEGSITEGTKWKETYTFLNEIPDIHAVDGGCENLEFNKSSATKASGLLWLTHFLGMTMKEVVAIGDSENDKEMIEEAGLGIAMANASEELKACADEVTLSNDEDGVAIVLEKFVK